MADESLTSHAKTIDPNHNIKGPDLRQAFEKTDAPNTEPQQSSPAAPPLSSQQVAQTKHSPASPAPNAPARTAGERPKHEAKMQTDDTRTKAAYYNEVLSAINKQKAAEKIQTAKAKSHDRDREIGDD